MGSVGDCFDNAMAESFFATLECELLALHSFQTHNEARAAVFEWLEVFYNRIGSDGIRRSATFPPRRMSISGLSTRRLSPNEKLSAKRGSLQ
jgi:transposase InsO family protein